VWKSGPAELKSLGYFVNVSNPEKICGLRINPRVYSGILAK
jgi:hypothetical protein